MNKLNTTNQLVAEFAKVLAAPAPLLPNETLHRFEDGDETITVRVRELPNRQFIAVDNECPNVAGFGFTSLGAIADLFEKLPRARSEREERDDLAAKWDHARDLRKHGAV